MTRILIIEDEQTVRENLLELLEAEGFEATGAENGAIGARLALSYLPDLIISDVMMPELDGFGVLELLRKNPLTDTIPFIFLTAKVDPADLRRGMCLGADDYLTKPIRAKDLLQAIATRLEKQAAIERQQAQKLDELRGSITLSLPHELRTPLNGILGCAEVLIADYEALEPDERLEMLEGIRTSGKRLYRLIQNFLLYAELELISTDPGRLKLLRSEQTQYVKTLIADQAMQQACAANREADLHLKLVEVGVQISANRLNKVVEELVQNAFKFSSPGTPVTISNRVEDDTLILSITDNGRGMSAEQIAGLGAYQQFERKLYEQQGSGLGLMIAKRLSELHAGTLTIESIPEQKTTVLVALPLLRDCASESASC
ncbi:MAG: hybrid sensor histidine kinase/response regulator [Tolypothrix sp. T3-bin4]|nr:hybrid sensor histidine kinase/response regulator [Tolypothrix sp. T3-bin4]